ncbi:MAG: acyltransferase family protein [Flavisolibacter sp.]
MNYIKQLDSVRAIAVFLVIIWHWVPRNSLTENLHSGSLGVNIFFVLSGFLITQLLLRDRHKAEQLKGGTGTALKNFYARRILRIFPIYYFAILLTSLLNNSFAFNVSSGELVSNLTYTSNFYIYLHKGWPVATLHFWSLAVEEQFYLVWPLLILFLPKRSLLAAILSCIILGLVSQLLASNHEFGHLPTYTCLDSLAIGGLIAFLFTYHPELLRLYHKPLAILAALCCLIIFVNCFFHYYIPILRFLHAIISAWLVNHILLYREKQSLLNRVLNSNPLVKIGKVSYGIYVYHMLYVFVAGQLWYKYIFDHYSSFINRQFEPWIFLLINFPILYFTARLSWKFIESPFLSLKTYFRHEPAQTSFNQQSSDLRTKIYFTEVPD